MKNVFLKGASTVCLCLILLVAMCAPVSAAQTLIGLSITGANSLNENSSTNYQASAVLRDTVSGAVTSSTVTTTAAWQENSNYVTLAAGRLTASEVTANQSIVILASYTLGGVTKSATKSVTIVNVALVLSGISIGGPSSVSESSSSAFPVTAIMSNGTTKIVTAAMTEDSQYATFNGSTLTTTAVTGNQTVNLSASYTEGGITKTATKQISVTDIVAPPPPIGSHAGRFTSYAGATTCLPCHRTQAVAAHNSEHYQWAGKLGKINDFCIYPDPNGIGKLTNTQGFEVDGGCYKCHPGQGAKPVANTTPTDAQLANVDCLVCHSPNYKRTVDPVTKTKYLPDEAAMGMTILEAAVDIRKTNRDTCLNCHTKSGGGNNNKRGDIEEAHRNVTDRNFDVHMYGGSTNANMHCTSCHTVSNHKISGKGMDLRVEEGTKVDCASCHTAAPHKTTTTLTSANATKLNTHTKRINCTTCHIPQYAKTATTDVFRDWSAHGELNTTTWLYDPVRTLQKALTPSYSWWNGQSQFYNFNTAATPGTDGKVLMAGPTVASAATANAKIYPVKIHEALQPIDIVSKKLLPLKIGQFYMQGDLTNAIPLGQDAVGWPRNAYDFQRTKRVMGLFHEVSPKTAAIGYQNCNVCHNTTTPKVPLKTLGYTTKTGTNGQPMTVNQVCSQCHSAKSYSFDVAHVTRSDHTREDCSRCHNFSKAP